MSAIPPADLKDCCCRKSPAAETVLHLPVAPQVVARTRFSPPTPLHSRCLVVAEALELVDQTMATGQGRISMAAITGPGDPLATPEITLEAVRMVRRRYPELPIGLKTLGIGSEKLAGELARAGVTCVEMLVDGIKADILEKIYAWIRPGLKTLGISEAVNLLIKEQRNGVSALKFHDIGVTIVTTLYPGLNIDHVPKISAAMLVLGADGMALLPYAPAPGAEVHLHCPDQETVSAATEKVKASLPVVKPLLTCFPGQDADPQTMTGTPLPRPSGKRRNVAVASADGMEIDLHLGQAMRLLIYGPRDDGLACLLETREVPEPGTGSLRWTKLATILHDCFAVLAASAGETPRRVLAEAGIKVLLTENAIEGAVDSLYGGGKKKMKRTHIPGSPPLGKPL